MALEKEEKGVLREGRCGEERVEHVERVARENASLLGEEGRSKLAVGEEAVELVERRSRRFLGLRGLRRGFGGGFGGI